mgnify:CR=1 FL=1
MKGALAGLCLLALPGTAWAEAACAPTRLDLRWDGGHESFAVEVADDAGERAQGLMFRTALPERHGMLFDFGQDQAVAFWMKNTLIPLDMIFIRADGTIDRIAENTVPQSLEPVASGGMVAAVLEVPGGTAARLGIDESATVTWTDRH